MFVAKPWQKPKRDVLTLCPPPRRPDILTVPPRRPGPDEPGRARIHRRGQTSDISCYVCLLASLHVSDHTRRVSSGTLVLEHLDVGVRHALRKVWRDAAVDKHHLERREIGASPVAAGAGRAALVVTCSGPPGVLRHELALVHRGGPVAKVVPTPEEFQHSQIVAGAEDSQRRAYLIVLCGLPFITRAGAPPDGQEKAESYSVGGHEVPIGVRVTARFEAELAVVAVDRRAH
eukprot:744611-Prymnesium_polylepis.2